MGFNSAFKGLNTCDTHSGLTKTNSPFTVFFSLHDKFSLSKEHQTHTDGL